MKTIAIVSQKGGVGKTSVCLGIGAKLVTEGKKVLFIDADGQKNLSQVFYIDTEGRTLYDILTGKAKIKDSIIKTENGDIIAASPQLATFEGKITCLKSALEEVGKDYDYCLIDCPPNLGLVSLNALMCADGCIIPIHIDSYSLNSIDETMATVKAIQQHNRRTQVLGLAINEYKGNTRLAQTVYELIQDKAKEYGIRVFNTKIRTCIKIGESAFTNEPNIFTYSKNSNAAEDFANLTEEVKGCL